jgi:hypothetical protein
MSGSLWRDLSPRLTPAEIVDDAIQALRNDLREVMASLRTPTKAPDHG